MKLQYLIFCVNILGHITYMHASQKPYSYQEKEMKHNMHDYWQQEWFNVVQHGTVKQVDKFMQEHQVPLDSRMKDGDTALMLAAMANNKEVVEFLLGHASLRIPGFVNFDNNDGDTALIIAARKGYLDIVKELLEADANPAQENKDGESALSIARGNTSLHNLLSQY